MAMDYKFPFSTCEHPTKHALVQQPYSTAINALSTLVLFMFAMFARTLPVQTTIIVYALFEAWHTMSHMQHIPGKIQKFVVHALGLSMAFATGWAIQSFTNAPVTMWYIAPIVVLVIVDTLVTTLYKNDLLGFATGLAIFAWVVIGHWSYYPTFVKNTVVWLLLGVVILMALFVNEWKNCDRMQKWRVLPYHALIEVLGLVLFSVLALLLLKWERL
jgi:hypothetical protein